MQWSRFSLRESGAGRVSLECRFSVTSYTSAKRVGWEVPHERESVIELNDFIERLPRTPLDHAPRLAVRPAATHRLTTTARGGQ